MKYPPQAFCTNCGQPLVPGSTFCALCGTRASGTPAAPTGAPAPGMMPASPPYQVPAQTDDLLLAAIAAGPLATRRQRRLLRQANRAPRRPRARLRGCGCLMLVLVLLLGPFIGFALTTGKLHTIFTYATAGMLLLLILFFLIGALSTRRGREALSEGLFEGLLESFFDRG